MRRYLKVEILLKFGSQTRFSRACEKSDFWISRLVNGLDDPSEEEKRLILEKLGITDGDYIFQDWNKKDGGKNELNRI